MTELEEAKERADAAVELALQAQQRLKIREEVLTLQVVVQESLKKSIEDSRERALREVERLKAELAIERENFIALLSGSKMTECYTGPLFGAGWNGCIEHLLTKLQAVEQ